MVNEIVVIGMGLMIALILRWGFKTLPQERWQILAAMPKEKRQQGHWQGLNLTYYGVFNANANALATAVFFMLMGSIAIPMTYVLIITISLFLICLPAARIIAKIVEKKTYTLSVAGAAFAGILTLPWLLWLSRHTLGQWLGLDVQILVVMSAMSIAYAFGEGIGRLACISFGCCYGKPIEKMPPFWRKLFQEHSFVFTGPTKKIAYADNLECQNVLPIQAITAVIYCSSGLLGFYLFLKGFFFTAFAETLIITLMWRFVSEFLRADHRGGGKVTAYQIMGVFALFYALVVAAFFPVVDPVMPDVLAGMQTLWDPVVIIFLQGLWMVVFLNTGRSRVTGSNISFYVIEANI